MFELPLFKFEFPTNAKSHTTAVTMDVSTGSEMVTFDENNSDRNHSIMLVDIDLILLNCRKNV